MKLLLHERNQQRIEYASLLRRGRNGTGLHCRIEQEHQPLQMADVDECVPLAVAERSRWKAVIAVGGDPVGGHGSSDVSDVHRDVA